MARFALSADSMRITKVAALVLRLPDVTDAADGTQDTCLIRIDTDAGITGWGEVDSAPTVVKAAVDAPLSSQVVTGLANAIEGANPLSIDDCMARMDAAATYYARSGAGLHAMAGINIALWDIAGKACDSPIYRMFGAGRQTRFRAYASSLFGDTPSETHERAARARDMGFTAVKLGWGPMGQSEESDITHVREARRGAGSELDLMIDAGQVWDWRTALRRAQQFAEFRPFWLEEPLHPEDIAGFARLSAASPVPIAGGESDARLHEFERLIVEGGVDWVQADPGRCGISEMVEIGRLAARHRVGFVNHTFKTGVSMAASLHVLAAAPQADVFEYAVTKSPIRYELTHEKFEVVDGLVQTPDGPGLGITIDMDTIEKYGVV